MPAAAASLATTTAGPDLTAAISTRADEFRVMQMARLAIWLLPVLTFTLPGRFSPSTPASMDALGVIKLVILLFVFFVGGLILAVHWRPLISRSIVTPMVPYLAFLGWAILSVLWSALPAVSVGQAGGQAALLVLTLLVGLVSHDAGNRERLLRSLTHMLLACSIFVLVVHVVAPGYSGLDRRLLVDGKDGVVHPTAAGSTASLGLLLASLCYFVARYRWATLMGAVCVLIHGTVLYFASSRMSLAMAVITVGMLVAVYTQLHTRAWMVFAAGALALLAMLSDPGFQSVVGSDSAGVKYITRGQSSDELAAVSGREEMWTKIWNEYLKSPLIGHGYFVSSETGMIEVWFIVDNHTAHNVLLQILVGTGIIGMVLFLLALGALARAFLSLRHGDRSAREVFAMLVITAVWYLGWSTLCESFMGPVRSESVFFYTFVGLGLGQLSRIEAYPRAAGVGFSAN